MDEAGAPGGTLAHESEAFIGFGGCVYDPVTRSQFDHAEHSEQIISLLARALRTQCIKQELKIYNNLVKGEFIKLDSDKTFDILADHGAL